MTTLTISAAAPPRDRLEQAGLLTLLGFVGALQLSIAVAEILLIVALICWAVSLAVHHDRIDAPHLFTPLLVYAGVTLVSSAFSSDPAASFIRSRQLLLFLIVPAVYHLARGEKAKTVVQIIITVGAASAAIGIIQYGIFHYDNLGQRPRGLLGHYMTYSGLLMMVIAAAMARLLFEARDRTWPALVMPALLVAVALTFTRSAWVGACFAVALLFVLKDFRLLALLPVLAALFFALAPAPISQRFYSMFNMQDPTNRDRMAMTEAGASMIRAHPLVGVGPNMVGRLYPGYRAADAVQEFNPHLHNVPLQIAAERGLPALGVWLWFIGTLVVDLAKKFRSSRYRFLPATGLATVAAMLAAGMFEYNFGDSEFLMLFLVLVTLPFAADRDSHTG